MKAFIDGCAVFLSQLGVPLDIAKAFVALVAISFALTTLDSATRLLRFNISEMGETLKVGILGNRYVSSFLAVVTIGFFAFYKIGDKPAGLALWQLFGTTNQVMGALTLLAVTLYLMQRKRNYWYTAIPMLFMMITTVIAMVIKLKDFWELKTYPLLIVGVAIIVLAIWLAVEASIRVAKLKVG
jgi:carbon starvation protein